MKRTLLILCSLVLNLSVLLAQQIPATYTNPSIPFPMYWRVEPKQFVPLKNGFTIVAGPKSDMFRDPNVTYNTDNAPKLLFQPHEDFVLSTAIAHDHVYKWDGGAIVLLQDSLNWVKFCFEKDYTGARRVVTVVTRNLSDDANSIEIKGNKVYFKVAKAGPVITLYCSTDQKKWLLVRHFQLNSTLPVQAGFLAQSPTGEKCSVTFSDIRYEAKKIKDPYTAE